MPLPKKLEQGTVLPVVRAEKKQGFTSPPKVYTEDTLLSAMETAGNKEFDKDTEKKGLGTPATRAAILEKLVSSGYVQRNYFRDDKLVQQAISDMEKLMAARQQSKEQERGSTKKSVLDALRSLKAKKQEQPAQEQDKPKKAKKKGMEL